MSAQGTAPSIGRFLVFGSAGGGSASVFAYDPQLDRRVTLTPVPSGDELYAHALALARVSHPNVIAVHELATVEGRGYVVMEHVEGASLRAWLAARPRGWREILATMIAAGAGLAAAHRAGVAHGTFDADRVQVGSDGRTRVTGFALDATGDREADQRAYCLTLRDALDGKRPPRGVERALQRGLAARWPSMEELLTRLRSARALGRRVAVGAAAVVVVAAAFLVGRHVSATPACGRAEARLAGIWDDARRQAVLAAGASAADGAWQAAGARVDRYTRDWAAMYTEACEATRVAGRQSERLLDLRMACLERRRALLGALTDLWVREPSRLDAAPDAAERLPSLAECADARGLLQREPEPREPALRARVAAARRGGDAAQALYLAGRTAEAAQAAAVARVEAQATGWPAARADAAMLEAQIRVDLGQLQSRPLLLETVRLANEERDDRLAARALVLLARQLADVSRVAADALLVGELASAAVARVGDDPTLHVELEIARGQAYATAMKLPEARAALTAARDAANAAFGSRHHLTLLAQANLVNVLMLQGEYAAARAQAEDNLKQAIEVFGEGHGRVAGRIANLGRILYELTDYAGANALYRRALAITEKAEGVDSVGAARLLNNIGIVEEDLNHLEEARLAYERALAIRERVLGADHPYVASTLNNLGMLRRHQGRYAEALAFQRRALAIKEKSFGAEHVNVASTVENIGFLLGDVGDLAGALGVFEHALAITTRAYGPDAPRVQQTLGYLSVTLADLGRCEEARPKIAAALPRVDGRPDRESMLATFYLLLARGRCELSSGGAGAAVATLNHALSMLGPDPIPSMRGMARETLARALWATGRRPQALAMAALAEQDLAGPESARERDALRAWLASRRR